MNNPVKDAYGTVKMTVSRVSENLAPDQYRELLNLLIDDLEALLQASEEIDGDT